MQMLKYTICNFIWTDRNHNELKISLQNSTHTHTHTLKTLQNKLSGHTGNLVISDNVDYWPVC